MAMISESKRIILGWGRKNGKTCYFISHKTIEGPVPCSPEDLKDKLGKLTDSIDAQEAEV